MILKNTGFNNKRTNFKKIIFVVFLVLHLLYMGMWGTKKINYHIDEYYTYGLANNRDSIEPVLEDGVIYKGETLFVNYLAPDETERFDYSIVWENQAKDVHPPLYYIFVHTICSFFPDVFSKWEALTLNLAFLIVVDILVYLIAKRMFENQWTPFWTMAINGMTMLCLNMVLFLRMYTLMTIFVLGVTGLFLEYWNRALDKKFYMLLFFISVGGALTQYYFLIYLFFSVLIFEMLRFAQKKWGKETFLLLLTMGSAGIISVIIFPPMLEQIFGNGYRGKQAFDNARSMLHVSEHILEYTRIINNELFGSCGILFLILAVCYVVLALFGYKKWNQILPLTILIIPTVCYCFVISVIAPYQYDRYIMAVGPLFVLTAVWLVYQTMDYVCIEKYRTLVNVMIVGIFGIVIAFSMFLSGWDSPYTYQSTRECLKIAEFYQDCPVLFVYNAPWTVNDKMQELIGYQSYVFLKEWEVDSYTKVKEKDKLVIYISNSVKSENVISSIQENNPKLTEVKMLYRNTHPDFASVYYLSGK